MNIKAALLNEMSLWKNVREYEDNTWESAKKSRDAVALALSQEREKQRRYNTGCIMGLPCEPDVKRPSNPTAEAFSMIGLAAFKGAAYTLGALIYGVAFLILLVLCIPLFFFVFSGIDSVYAVAGPGLGFMALFMFFAFLDRGGK